MNVPSQIASPRIDSISSEPITGVYLVLTESPRFETAIDQCIQLAKRWDVLLWGVAPIDAVQLFKVGPVPLGGNIHAANLRKWRLATAKKNAESLRDRFLHRVRHVYSNVGTRIEEGEPIGLLRPLASSSSILSVTPTGSFHFGVFDKVVDLPWLLVQSGVFPILVAGIDGKMECVRFFHDGTQRSDATWRWLVNADLWPTARLILDGYRDASLNSIERLLQYARNHGRYADQTAETGDPREFFVIGNGANRSWWGKTKGWFRKSPDRLLAIG